MFQPPQRNPSFKAQAILLENSSSTLETAELDLLSITQILQSEMPFTRLKEIQLTIHTAFLLAHGDSILDLGFCKHAWMQCFARLRSLAIITTSVKSFFYEYLAGLLITWLTSNSVSGSDAGRIIASGLQLDKVSLSGSRTPFSTELSAFLGSLCSHVRHVVIDCEATEVIEVVGRLTSVETLELAIYGY